MKKNRKTLKAMILLSTITFMFFGNLTAQDQFRLSDYKNPDYKWKQLDLQFGLGGSNSYNKQEIEFGTSENQKDLQVNSNLRANYYGTKNSSHYQGYQNLLFSGSVNSDNYSETDLVENLENTRKTNFQDFLISAQTVNRFYNDKKRFAEIDLDIHGQLNNTTGKYSDDQETYPFNYKSAWCTHIIMASLPLLIGTGRIEEVQDARLAVYILDDLTKAGDLKKIPTNEETMAFAQFITETKNQRFFDSRIRKIAEITAIDSFLTVRNLKSQSDASYYTLLNDNWDNSNGPVRETGGRFSVGLMPAIDLSYHNSQQFYRDTLSNSDVIDNYTHKSNSHDDSWNLDVVAGYAWEKPSSLYWQHSFNTGIAYSLYYEEVNSKVFERDTLTLENSIRLDSPNLELDLGYSIGYYPNSRTSIKLGIITSYNQFWGKETGTAIEDRDAGKIIVNNDLVLSCYYYISPQIRFYLDISSRYSFNKLNETPEGDEPGYKKTHNLQNRISASLTYSIF
jgi:hypothetical protein